jgi:hypothetical protein
MLPRNPLADLFTIIGPIALVVCGVIFVLIKRKAAQTRKLIQQAQKQNPPTM